MLKSILSRRSRGVVHVLRLGLALCRGLAIVEAPTTAQRTQPEGLQQDMTLTLEAMRRAVQD